MATCAPVSFGSNHVYLAIGVLPPVCRVVCSREQRAEEQDAVPHDCPPPGTAFAAEGPKTLRVSGQSITERRQHCAAEAASGCGSRAVRPRCIRGVEQAREGTPSSRRRISFSFLDLSRR